MRFEDKTVIITGASGGIGSESARRFAKEGASVVINYFSSAHKAKEVEKNIEQDGGTAFVFKADVSNPTEIKAMIKKTIIEYNGIDVLVNNAAQHPPPAFDFDNPDWNLWKRMIHVNIMGLLICSHFSAPYLRKTHGNIVNIVMDHDPGSLGYVLTKTAGSPLTKGLARKLAPVRVNTVSPGVVKTWNMDDNEKREWLKTIPLKRVGQPEDIAKAILFLASSDASYITGETIHVDGGRQMEV